MLRELWVRNLALIEELRLEFAPGLNVLTGETGAGKSIIIDAVSLVLGGRAAAEMIRAGAETATAEGVFDCDGRPELRAALEELGLEAPEGVVALYREIGTGGRSRCRINGQTVTSLTLAKLGALLVDIHGQHEHQSLLHPDKQLDLLDRVAGEEVLQLRGRFAAGYAALCGLRQELATLRGNEEELKQRVELLQFQLQEIGEAKLKPDEDEALQSEHELFAGAERLFAASARAYELLYESGAGQAALEQIGEARRALEGVLAVDPRLEPCLSMLREAAAQGEEAARELRNYRERLEFDPARLAEVEKRLDELAKLKRKYGRTVAEIIAYGEKIAAELNGIEHRDERLAELEKEVGRAEAELAETGKALSARRRAQAGKMQAEIARQLEDLNMGKVTFRIDLNLADDPNGLPYEGRRVAMSPRGLDRIEFLVAPNPGEGLKPMLKIASGGELSRIMLALKAIVAEVDELPTMIFDEIDVGIGGRTAQAVAEKMLLIGRTRQVVAVTHLPQIASLAHRHLLIEKKVAGQRTAVSVRALDMQERVGELARMLGGAEVTELTRKHAQEMLALAESLKLRKVGRTTLDSGGRLGAQ
ncbi:MAG: DNA repair protein RecN [Patescibacteria group bacterium]